MADFEMAALLLEFSSESYFSSSIGGAVRWIGPELFQVPDESSDSVGYPSTQGDVYSFGCIMLQVRIFAPQWICPQSRPRSFLAKSLIITCSVTHRSSLRYLQASNHCTQTALASTMLNGALSNNAGWLPNSAPL